MHVDVGILFGLERNVNFIIIIIIIIMRLNTSSLIFKDTQT